MRISGRNGETFLYLNGLQVGRPVKLSEEADLLPATCAPKPSDITALCRSEVDIGVAAVFLRSVRSQIRVRAESPEILATTAWNTLWDVVLLSAFCDCEVVCNLQCDAPAERFGSECNLEVTNYHLRGLMGDGPHDMTPTEMAWFEKHIGVARLLLDTPSFSSAVHCLATYRWHSLPRVQLAIIWAGIEGLFGIDSEIVFRLSLYAARYLAPEDKHEQQRIFGLVKKLYKQRSAAVHGSTIRGDVKIEVADSAALLRDLLRQCVHKNGLPDTKSLAP
jgi:hypothetical protein